jgi:hypothetical protein
MSCIALQREFDGNKVCVPRRVLSYTMITKHKLGAFERGYLDTVLTARIFETQPSIEKVQWVGCPVPLRAVCLRATVGIGSKQLAGEYKAFGDDDEGLHWFALVWQGSTCCAGRAKCTEVARVAPSTLVLKSAKVDDVGGM